ncbi:hypothetical protein FRC02_011994 [Tulasnella sp. 418]|nr:hypothetical protein FRC02_011994 [Tulasnella sp. 418]
MTSRSSKQSATAETDSNVSSVFNAEDADLILRSLDGVEFKVYRQILALASTVWADMFSLGATIHDEAESKKSSDPPVVSVTEKASILSDILSFVYPVPKPDVNTLDHCSDIIAIAEKYDVTGAMPYLRNILLSSKFLKESPIRVYAIACSYAWTAEAKEASRHTLICNILETPITPELYRINAVEYIKLIQLHRTRSQSAIAMIDTIQPANCSCTTPPYWYTTWATRAKEELTVRPNSSVIFGLEFCMNVLTTITSCGYCARSLMSTQTQAQFASCKERMDALPDTVQI